MIRLRIDEKRHGERILFQNFELQIARGEAVCLVGPSGCGKTSLLHILAGLDSRFSGHLQRDGAGRTGMLFQEPRLFPWRTVGQNLRMVMPHHAASSSLLESKSRHQHAIDAILKEMDLANCMDMFPAQLSLGMARRVALARSLLVEPDLILLDEPCVSLDPATADDMRDLLCRVRQMTEDVTLVMVSHDPQDARQLTDRVCSLAGSPTQVVADQAAATWFADRSKDRFALTGSW